MSASDDAMSGVPSEQMTSPEMLRQAAQHDPDACRRLVEQHRRLIWSWCVAAGLQPADADDVLQDVLQAVFARLQTFERRSPGAFRRWLYTVTQSKLVDFFRAVKRRTPAVGGTAIRESLERLAAPESDSCASSLDAALQAKRRLALEACEWVRRQVSEATWEAYLATEIEGLSPQDVGEEMGISINAVYIARSRCRKLLQAAKEHLPESPDHA